MVRFVAFLRAVTARAATSRWPICRPFAELGLARVETFLESRNVRFDALKVGARDLERAIEGRLERALGYPVATFVRSQEEVIELAQHAPFPLEAWTDGAALSVVFLHEEPTGVKRRAVLACASAVDELCIHTRHVFWLAHHERGRTTFSGAKLERLLGAAATLRSATTLQKPVAKHFAARGEAAGGALHGAD